MATGESPRQESLATETPTNSKQGSGSKEKDPGITTKAKKTKENKEDAADQNSEKPVEKKNTMKPLKKTANSTPSPEPQTKPKTVQRKKPQTSQKANPKPVQRMRPSSTQGQKSSAAVDPAAATGSTGEDPSTTKVKQFSFPGYKILSGASVAPVKMYPQKIVIKRGEDETESAPKRWAEGLFQNTSMSLKVRLLRLLLIWLFFRVLNKQSSWLADKLGVGDKPEEEPGMKPPKGKPGERYIRVFHDGAPHPFHVKVKQGEMGMQKP